jgi:DNA-binding response OmpR family regulator
MAPSIKQANRTAAEGERRIRKAIGDDRPPGLIQTIHGIGYRIKAHPA